MQSHFEVIQQILPLLETMEKALDHACEKIDESQHEAAICMIEDIIEGAGSINSALLPIINDLEEKGNDLSDVKEITNDLVSALQMAVKYYGEQNLNDLGLQIKNVIKISFDSWKIILEVNLRSLIIS